MHITDLTVISLALKVGSILVEPQPWKCYRNAVRRCRKLNLALPLHYSDLLYKDPDSAVCACMARRRDSNDFDLCSSSGCLSTPVSMPLKSLGSGIPRPPIIEDDHIAIGKSDRKIRNISVADITVGSLGCGLKSYSPLGTEVWGRSLLVFHSTDAPSDSAGSDCSYEEPNFQLKTLRILPLPSGLLPRITEVVEVAESNCKANFQHGVQQQRKEDLKSERIRKRKSLAVAEIITTDAVVDSWY